MLERVQGAPLLAWLTAALAQGGARRFFLVAQPGCMARAKACFPRIWISPSAQSRTRQTFSMYSSPPRKGGGANYSRYRPGGVSFRPCCPSAQHRLPKAGGVFCQPSGADGGAGPGLFLQPLSCGAGEPLHPGRRLLCGVRFRGTAGLAKGHESEPAVPSCPAGGPDLGPGSLLCEPLERGGKWHGAAAWGHSRRPQQCGLRVYHWAGHLSVRLLCGRWRPGGELPGRRSGHWTGLRGGSLCQPPHRHLSGTGSEGRGLCRDERDPGGRQNPGGPLDLPGGRLRGSGLQRGSGVATANFDRVDKHETVLEDGAFIGRHTSLVAPVRVGQGAYIGAGSVITQDVPAGALGVARSRQTNKKEWANRHKK
ncbi:MAG: hypothetical protein ACLU9S_01235 [Oscillospiraceae bacterium]